MLSQILKSFLSCHSVFSQAKCYHCGSFFFFSLWPKLRPCISRSFMQCTTIPAWLYLCKPLLENLSGKLVASAQLAIFLSQNVLLNTSIMLLWKWCYFNCWSFQSGILITLVPRNSFTECLEMSHRTLTSQAWCVWVFVQVPQDMHEASSTEATVFCAQSSQLLMD